MDKKNLIKYGFHAVILIGVIVAGVRYLNGEEVFRAIRSFNTLYLPVMLVLSVVYLLSKSWRFVLLMRPISNLSWKVFFTGYLAGTAAVLLPGGVALRAGLMDQAGVPLEKSSAPVAFSSILDQAVLITGSFLAAFMFEGARIPALVIFLVVAGLGLILITPQTRDWLLRASEKVMHRFRVLEQWKGFLSSVREVATARIMLVTLLISFGGLVLLILILDLCLRGFGHPLPYATLFLAFIVPTIIGRFSGIPGGFGVTEAGMVGFMVSTTGIDVDLAAAASVVFRIITVLFQVLLGALVYFFFWRGPLTQPSAEPKAEGESSLE